MKSRNFKYGATCFYAPACEQRCKPRWPARALQRHPRLGASWEGFALDQVLRVARPDAAYFWATHAGAERNLLMFNHGRRVGVEYKRSDAPTLTKSMQVAQQALALDALYVVYPGQRRYSLADRVQVVPLQALLP